MESYLAALGSAIWLGVLTSISPCPLATNIAAISYIGKRVSSPHRVFWAGLIYILGRTITYLLLGIILVAGFLSIPDLSNFLQKYINIFLGPVLVVTGVILLGLFNFSFSGGGISAKMQARVDRLGLWGAGLLGFLFALSFCPVSAALFFGSLISLAVKNESQFIMPVLYGIGTALPVFVFAVLIATGTKMVAALFNRLTRFELWARRITAVIFILTGTYYSLIYIFKLPL
ncbi:MAG: aromatic aminobenezylarsenical efflux permease ArsG family transporter [Candidatus Zixiibacteriota bacterium]